MHRVVDSVIADYRKRPDGGGAIGKLMDARDETTGEKLDAKALRNEAVVIFLAGHETTASTLAFALYILSQATDAEARLHVELDAVLGDRAPTLADVRACCGWLSEGAVDVEVMAMLGWQCGKSNQCDCSGCDKGWL